MMQRDSVIYRRKRNFNCALCTEYTQKSQIDGGSSARDYRDKMLLLFREL